MFNSSFLTKLSTMSDQISENGYWSCSNIFDDDSINLIEKSFNENIKYLTPAQISKGDLKTTNSEIRNDKNHWADQKNIKFTPVWSLLDKVSLLLKSELYLPIKRYESQLALYSPGDFYKRHVDKHQLMSSRLISSVFYISEWEKAHSGELVLYKNEPVIITPQKNSFIIFLSELEHEVLPTHSSRKSITSWFRDDIL